VWAEALRSIALRRTAAAMDMPRTVALGRLLNRDRLLWGNCLLTGGRQADPSLADAAVDAFAQQVGVPAVPGVLLDSVIQQLPDGDTVLP
jgi:hypothetical protein